MSVRHGTVWPMLTAPEWPNPWICPLLRVGEVAELLEVSRRTVYRMADEGEVPTFGHGHKRFPTALLMLSVGLPIPPQHQEPPQRPRVV
jgi:excisionase family DNA binding protein